MMKQIFKTFCVALLFTWGMVPAQFTITNTLKTNDATGLKIGDNATLTAATGVDPIGSGWLRLTNSTGSQRGYMYVQQSFPTSLGIIADFEYVTWRSSYDGYLGADGLSLFLFDGSITDANFKLGGYGGSLGYANLGNTPGLSGGYIGVGFDEYGNFARAAEGRNGGTTVLVPNAIVLRGPTSATPNASNPYLTHTALGDRTGGENAIRARDEIDYNTIVSSRPSPTAFYRRVQVYVTKSGNDYLINIKWRKQNETTFTEVLNYTMSGTTYPLPPTLKLGFAASTGGGFNFHEIRNILLTTPGNLRVDSGSNSASLCNDIKENPVTFSIEVSNDTAANLADINFSNQIQDAAGNLLDITKFKITSLSTTGFTSSTLPTSNFTSNNITGKVGLARKSSGIITITGNYFKKSIPTNQSFKSVSTVNSTEITDTDLTNNTATTVVYARKCSIITNPSLPSYNK
ncbi:hypothetical protein EIH07_09995 [Chryseobacterium taklimakanense]|uniref:hypothetical protein n=1 Tax=Chryseobacterium taklimakanense TaxID=536441 RepID=UPI000F5ED0A7|nr:hypothetical protein [Chryseobacterium taklimakanense]AZI23347.1 hypothetical protein EIH07_09995 [Chryseobacterium taklimakanense]